MRNGHTHNVSYRGNDERRSKKKIENEIAKIILDILQNLKAQKEMED